jgi:hypothetical protein
MHPGSIEISKAQQVATNGLVSGQCPQYSRALSIGGQMGP